MHACMHACMRVYMHTFTCICMYLCVCVCVCVCVYFLMYNLELFTAAYSVPRQGSAHDMNNTPPHTHIPPLPPHTAWWRRRAEEICTSGTCLRTREMTPQVPKKVCVCGVCVCLAVKGMLQQLQLPSKRLLRINC